MRKFIVAGAAITLLAACQSPEEQVADKEGEMIEDLAEGQADALEDGADAVRKADPGANSVETKARADDLEDMADAVRREGHVEAEEVRDAAKEAAAVE